MEQILLSGALTCSMYYIRLIINRKYKKILTHINQINLMLFCLSDYL